jgi:hypothetical protein
MRYSCHTLDNASWSLNQSEFLSDAATAILDECDPDVFEEWRSTFPSYKSLSPIVNSAILDRLDSSGDVIDPSKISNFRILRGFNNAKYSGDTCLQIFEQFKQYEGAEIVLYIPTTEFKKKFRFDSTYTTLEAFSDYYVHFVKVMEPRQVPIVHFIALEDLSFETAIYEKGKDRYLKLIYAKSN